MVALLLASCNPDDTTIPTATEKKLLFSKITFGPNDPADPSSILPQVLILGS